MTAPIFMVNSSELTKKAPRPRCLFFGFTNGFANHLPAGDVTLLA
ncbi:hypothetical protein HMPREF0201_01309 [Cedecea davisae DSM 4568]|uniref:Uncharacterized protein n=1 Tax=Cedecea davisae DSM 4568 TaxID=566551 RepID=S3K0B5_9ENTR|nr:hypothetical protein HMPREF0201_01309 [Cedecea davisae DSM 4568]